MAEQESNAAAPGESGGKAGGRSAGPGAGSDAAAKPDLGAAGAVGAGLREALWPMRRFVESVGNHIILCARALSWLPRRPIRAGNYVDAAEYIGYGSLPIIILVGAFTGMVMSLQSVTAFRVFGLEEFAGGTTGKGLAVELAPVLTALMLCGRAGAGIATEIGTMRISEQIDALESMAVNPVQFLILPRLVAGLLVAPILSLTFFIVGMGGAYLVAVIDMGVDHGQFVANIIDIVELTDVIQGLLKAAVFGFVVALIGCYQGYNATGGGRGVGMGTTRAVVIGSVSILIFDYFLTQILLTILPPGG